MPAIASREGWCDGYKRTFDENRGFTTKPVIRVGVPAAKKLFESEHSKPMDITGKPMKGWVMVAQGGFDDDSELKRYVDLAISFVKTLPAKKINALHNRWAQ